MKALIANIVKSYSVAVMFYLQTILVGDIETQPAVLILGGITVILAYLAQFSYNVRVNKMKYTWLAFGLDFFMSAFVGFLVFMKTISWETWDMIFAVGSSTFLGTIFLKTLVENAPEIIRRFFIKDVPSSYQSNIIEDDRYAQNDYSDE